MGGEDLSQEQQSSYLSTLMSPLLQQIERNLPNIKEAAPQLSPSDQAKAGKLPVNMVLQVCNFLHAGFVLPFSAYLFHMSVASQLVAVFGKARYNLPLM